MDNNKKKIVQFIHGLTSGGAETLVKEYAIELKRRGFDVSIMVLKSYPNMPNEIALRNENIPIYEVYSHCDNIMYASVNRLFNDIIVKTNVKTVLKKIEPDIIHVHLFLMQYLMISEKFLENSRIFYTCHSVPQNIFSTSNRQVIKNFDCMKMFSKRKQVKIIALHQAMKEEIDEIFECNDTIVLRNPITLGRYKTNEINIKQYRKEIGIPIDAYVIGHVGRFSSEKNHDWILTVFENCLKLNDRCFLLLIGDGELIEEVRSKVFSKCIQDRVLILSNRSDIPYLMRTMDVFLCPSKFEGFSLVSLEAQAAGCRCVISNSIPKDVIVTNNVSYLSLDESKEVWSDAVLGVSNNYTKQNSDLNDFDVAKVIDDLLLVYFE